MIDAIGTHSTLHSWEDIRLTGHTNNYHPDFEDCASAWYENPKHPVGKMGTYSPDSPADADALTCGHWA